MQTLGYILLSVSPAYWYIIGLSFLVILSYFFNVISKKTNIPSVLLLIVTGIIIQIVGKQLGVDTYKFFGLLEILGIVGLIMIVLEAALELELKREKIPLILRSFGASTVSLLAITFAIGYVLTLVLACPLYNALIYAVPIATISSAIVIPSVESLNPQKSEFLIYDSTFSDILGIMFFYFLTGSSDLNSAGQVFWMVSGNIFLTLLLAIVLSLVLIIIFQNIKSKIKLFLLISVLFMLYSVGKLMHLSSLIIILFFGLLIQNYHLINIKYIKKHIKTEILNEMLINLKVLTIETSFITRTFFFIVFGLTISLGALLSFKVFLISIVLLIILFGVRFLVLKLFLKQNFLTEFMIAPRGLITILLFFSIDDNLKIDGFSDGILLYIILITAIVMTYAMIKDKKKNNQINIDKEVNFDDDFDDDFENNIDENQQELPLKNNSSSIE